MRFYPPVRLYAEQDVLSPYAACAQLSYINMYVYIGVYICFYPLFNRMHTQMCSPPLRRALSLGTGAACTVELQPK